MRCERFMCRFKAAAHSRWCDYHVSEWRARVAERLDAGGE